MFCKGEFQTLDDNAGRDRPQKTCCCNYSATTVLQTTYYKHIKIYLDKKKKLNHV